MAGRGFPVGVWVTQSLTANNRSRAALTDGECVLSCTRAADRSRMGLAAAYDVTSPGRSWQPGLFRAAHPARLPRGPSHPDLWPFLIVFP